MDEKQKTFSELQEIIFWQQINKQLIELKISGKPIRDEHQRYIQRFCFDNKLFSKITNATLLDEVPMGLITDLSGISFINLRLSSWNRCLTQLIPNTHVLDIEQALTDSFDALGKYDKKYYPDNRKDADEEDDEELYEFMETYLGEKEKQGRNIGDIILSMYESKNDLIEWIMRFIDYKPFIVMNKNRLLFDFSNPGKEGDIVKNYKGISVEVDKFCKKAVSAIEPIIFPLKEMDLYGLLLQKGDEKNLKPSIKQFVDHEISIFQTESNLLRTFYNNVQARINSPDSYEIDICDLFPFFFLDYPFPTI